MIVTGSLCAFLPALLLLQEQVTQLNNSSSSLLDLVLRSSLVAKFVLLILLLFSIVSWAIIFSKARATRVAQEHTAGFMEVFEKSSGWGELYANSASFNLSPLRAILIAANAELEKQSRLNLEAVHRVMQSAAISETNQMERHLGWLASTASASPFIGLFGTVVGIIIAFQGLSQAATASIQAVAPGIADALLATAAGIAAAVPAVLAYNHYVNRIKVIAAEMDGFALRLLNFIEREAIASTEAAMQQRRGV